MSEEKEQPIGGARVKIMLGPGVGVEIVTDDAPAEWVLAQAERVAGHISRRGNRELDNSYNDTL